MLRARCAILTLAIAWIGLATAPALATPMCVRTCRQETARCAESRCAALHGEARRACLETCKGIGGCARIGTLAYVVSKCTVGSFRQKFQIRRGDCDPVTVLDFPEPLERPFDCSLIGRVRPGFASSLIVGAFHRIGVSPDGRHVVFEVTDDFSVLQQKLVPPEQPEGIFIVRTDGRGLRRLGPASRDPSFRFAMDPASPSAFGSASGIHSPSAQTVERSS